MSSYEIADASQHEAGDIIDGRYKVLANGTLYDLQAKRFASGPQAVPTDLDTRITPDNALEYRHRRTELAKEYAADGMQRAVDDGMHAKTAGAEEAWGHVIEKQTELAISPEEGHASTQAAKLVGTATGMMGDRASAPTVAIQVNISDDIAARYLGEWDEE